MDDPEILMNVGKWIVFLSFVGAMAYGVYSQFKSGIPKIRR